jgi:hypothetical protein
MASYEKKTYFTINQITVDIRLPNGPSSEIRLTNLHRSFFGRQNISCPFIKGDMVIDPLSEQPLTED